LDHFIANSLFVAVAAMLLVLVGWKSYRRYHPRFLTLWVSCWSTYLVARLITMVQLGYGASLAPSAVVVMSICAQSLYYMHVVLMFGCLLALLGRADAWLRRRVLWLTLSVVVVVCTIVTVATMDSSVAV